MMPFFSASRDRPTGPLPWIAGIGAAPLAAAWLDPPSLPFVIGAFLAAGALVLAYRHLIEAWMAWLVLTGLSLEMTLTDLIGPEAFQVAIAAAKGGEIGLVALTILRHGMTWDRFNPAWGFAYAAALSGLAVVVLARRR